MPICKKCNVSFPNRTKINGKVRLLHKRQFCLSCSPFGLHNTRDITKVKLFSRKDRHKHRIDKICSVCNELKSIPSHMLECLSCVSYKRRQHRKQKATEAFGNQCCFCSYNRCNKAFDFHHVHPEQKKFELCSSWRLNWDEIVIELSKCIMVCRNCHAEIHQGLIGNEMILEKFALTPGYISSILRKLN